MDSFALSPGITPQLTDAAVTAYLVLLGAGVIVGGRRGFVAGFAAATVAIAIIKLQTDWSDTYDDAVAFVAIAVGAAWGVEVFLSAATRARIWAGTILLGVVGIYVGWIKTYTDYYDPFDLLTALSAMIAGVALVMEPVRDRVLAALERRRAGAPRTEGDPAG
jgi:hypothetical protein